MLMDVLKDVKAFIDHLTVPWDYGWFALGLALGFFGRKVSILKRLTVACWDWCWNKLENVAKNVEAANSAAGLTQLDKELNKDHSRSDDES